MNISSVRQSINADTTTSDESGDNEPLIYQEEIENVDRRIKDGKFPKTRHILGFLGFLGFANVYAMRVNLSVSIVAMVNNSAIAIKNDTVNDSCPIPSDFNNETIHIRDGEFLWDEQTQGIVLGSFFYGYVLSQLPGGRLAESIGGKYVYGLGILFTSIFTLLTPIAAYSSLPALILIRVLTGLCEGVTFPSMMAMMSQWIPITERARFSASVYAGSNFGTIVSLPLSGWLCALSFMGGWPLSFYIFGGFGLLWCFFWFTLVSNTPAAHPRISPDEREYIESKLKVKQTHLNNFKPNESVPWKSILTSAPLWGLIFTQCGQSWAFYTQLTELPTYMSRILHFNIEDSAFLSALPHLTVWIFAIVSASMADWMLTKGMISQKNSYRLWNTVTSVIPSIGLCAVVWAGCDKIWVMIMLAGFGAFAGACYPGNQTNHIVLSPRFGASMYGLANGAGNICGFLAPYIIGGFIKGNENFATWSHVFYLAAFLNVAGNCVYLFLVQAEEQPWSKQRHHEHE